MKIERGLSGFNGLTLIFIRVNPLNPLNPRSIFFPIKTTLAYAVGTSTQRRSRAATRMESATAWARIPS
jgi:hypothetical protein